PRRELRMISDFQRTGWDAENGAAGVRLPPGTQVSTVSVAGPETENLAVTGVEFGRESLSGRERVVATARLGNRGTRPASGVPVVLEIDGRPLETVAVDLPASGAATASFRPFTLPAANTRGTVRAGDDPLPADNRFHFVLSPGEAVG